MQKKQNLFSAAIVIAMVALLLLPSLGAATTVASDDTTRKIGTGHSPSVSANDIIVYPYGNLIHLYAGGKDSTIKVQNPSSVTINEAGEIIVWKEVSTKGVSRIGIFQKGKVTYIANNVDTTSIPAISGKRVVWTTGNAIHSYDVASGKQGADLASDCINPRIDISGDLIAYEYLDGGVHKIALLNVINSQKTTITFAGDLMDAKIDDDQVVSVDFNGNLEIFDIDSNTIKSITAITPGHSDENEIKSYDIKNKKIIYDLSVADPSLAGVYVYDTASGETALLSLTFQSPTGEKTAAAVTISETGKAVWQYIPDSMYPSVNSGIYCRDTTQFFGDAETGRLSISSDGGQFDVYLDGELYLKGISSVEMSAPCGAYTVIPYGEEVPSSVRSFVLTEAGVSTTV
ncbi:MAG: hypothetical protein PHX30_03495 [Candidatus Pacebacteria bacterium]|nr:hypothetical protein [Candidatus Paceibacterota bacterium]